jgi:hypothetical protein
MGNLAIFQQPDRASVVFARALNNSEIPTKYDHVRRPMVDRKMSYSSADCESMTLLDVTAIARRRGRRPNH